MKLLDPAKDPFRAIALVFDLIVGFIIIEVDDFLD